MAFNPFNDESQIKLVMFDLDGTLVDSVPDLHAAVSAMLTDLKRQPVSLADITNWVGNGAAMLVKRALSNNVQVDETLNTELFDRAYEKFIHHYHQTNGQHARLYEGVHELFHFLKQQDLHIAIITNKPEQFTLPLLEQLGVAAELVLSGDSLPEKKPHPAPVLASLRHFSADPSEAVMIGDSVSDVNSAKAANVRSIAVSYGYNHGQSVTSLKADRMIDSLMALIPESR